MTATDMKNRNEVACTPALGQPMYRIQQPGITYLPAAFIK